MILGDLGADVIKVEPVAGDGMRMVNQAFFGCTRGKPTSVSTSRATEANRSPFSSSNGPTSSITT